MNAIRSPQEVFNGIPKTGAYSGTYRDSPASQLLHKLLISYLIRPRDWEILPESEQERLGRHTDKGELLAHLVGLNLLTEYQADRIDSGSEFGLILGNYRVLS